MKHRNVARSVPVLLWTLAVLASVASGQEKGQQVPSFPGAEGFAVNEIIGGRGGEVRKVTNLSDSGPGSFRAAVEGNQPKIVVFEVSGIIRNLSVVRIGDNTTIAGQSSPAGITFYNWDRPVPKNNRRDPTAQNGGLHIGSNVVIRHIRARGSGYKSDPYVTNGATNVVLDHVSVSWGGDQSGCFWQGCQNITIQWCAFEEAVGFWHGEGPHNYGPMIASGPNQERPNGNFAFHHNLMTHQRKRNPEMQLQALMGDVRNNVAYNAGMPAAHDGRADRQLKWPGNPEFNIVANYRKLGPLAAPAKASEASSFSVVYPKSLEPEKVPRVYLDGNKVVDVQGELVSQDKLHTWARPPGPATPVMLKEPAPGPSITTYTADDAYELVMAKAGAWPRDATSRRTIEEVEEGTGGWVMMPKELMMEKQWDGWAEKLYQKPFTRFYQDEPNDWPNPAPPKDGDNDGMPDEWELAHGLNPADPADAQRTVPQGASPQDRHAGYHWVEYYLNALADDLDTQAMEAWLTTHPASQPVIKEQERVRRFAERPS